MRIGFKFTSKSPEKCSVNHVNKKFTFFRERTFARLSSPAGESSRTTLHHRRADQALASLDNRAPSHSPLAATPVNHRLTPSPHRPYQPSPADWITRQLPRNLSRSRTHPTCTAPATQHSLFFVLALAVRSHASTLRLFGAIRFLFSFFWRRHNGNQHVSSNADFHSAAISEPEAPPTQPAAS